MFPASVFAVGVNMVKLWALGYLTYLTQVTFPVGNAQTDSSQLMDLIPKREVFYVGGQYTNISVSLEFDLFYVALKLENRIMPPILRQWP